MKNAKQLKDKYDHDLEQLQKTCEHKDLSDWIEEWTYVGCITTTGFHIKQCQTCWKIVEKKKNCPVCEKEFSVDIDEPAYMEALCPECSKKGKYYCWEHKQFYNDPQGGDCTECYKFLKKVEKSEKKEKELKR